MPKRTPRSQPERKLRIAGVSDLLTHFARCCQPVPPDVIRGYITRGRGISVHRVDCPHFHHLESREPDRIVEVNWNADGAEHYPVDVVVAARDRQGLLRDIAGVMSDQKVNILGMNARHARENGKVLVDLTLEIRDLAQLGRLLNRLNGIGGVDEARRKLGA